MSSSRSGRGCSRLPARCTAARNLGAARRGGGRSMASNEDARAAREAKLDELHEKLTGAVESLVSGDDWV